MSYQKIYYDEIWEIASKATKLCNEWAENMNSVGKSISGFTEDRDFKGTAATNMKNYLEQVHGILDAILSSVITSYMGHVVQYYNGFETNVDSGDGSKYGVRYTTIVYGEVNPSGTVKKKIDSIINRANTVADQANNVKRDIAGLLPMSSAPRVNELINQLNRAAKKATDVSQRADSYEAARRGDLADIDTLIAQAQNILNRQLGKGRVSVTKYMDGSIGRMCDIKKVSVSLTATGDYLKTLDNNEEFEAAIAYVAGRDEIIAQEEKDGRKWVKWIAVGVAIAGAVVLTVVTAGGASPLICVAVGGATGLVTTATDKFTDNYVEHGSLTEGMDWSQFGKDCLKGTVSGMVSGYFGSVASAGSVIKQPIEKGLTAVAKVFIDKGATGLIDTAWDVGEAIIKGKPGGEILSIAEKDLTDTFKGMIVDGASDFVSEYIAGKFGVSSASKGFWQKMGEETVKNLAGTATGFGITAAWDGIGGWVTGKSGEDVIGILKDDGADFLAKFAKKEVNSFFSTAKGSVSKSIGKGVDNKTTKKFLDSMNSVVMNMGGGFASNGADAYVKSKLKKDYVFDTGDFIRTSVKEGGIATGKDQVTAYFKEKDKELQGYLRRKAYDGTAAKSGDHVEIVVFGKYSVLKEDYDAAVANAGKGAYKDMTAQDILGLPRNTPISESHIRVEKVNINDLKESDYQGKKTTNVKKLDIKTPSDKMKDQNLFTANKKGQYEYTENEYGKKATGQLTLKAGERDLNAQRTVGGADRRPDDDGGHLIGTRFGGSGTEENLDAQNSNLNRSNYKRLEDQWAKDLEEGKKVYVNIETYKSNGSERPDAYMGYAITEWKDGSRQMETFSFENESTATQEEWNAIMDSLK